MFKHGYPELFKDDAVWLPRARAMAERVYEFTEYVVDRLGVTDLEARWDGMLTYHSSCHTLRDMNIDRQPRTLLANIRGAQVVELPHADECCGFGGIFSLEHPELSAEWLKRKIGNLGATWSPTLIVTDAGCLMHIAGGLHMAEVLNHGYTRRNYAFRIRKILR
jgi:L-lactate dehydrogenase complex protein LldE